MIKLTLLNLLAQATNPATQPGALLAAGTDEATKSPWHAPWEKWLTFYSLQTGATAIATFAVLVLSYIVLTRIFKKSLEAHKLQHATAWGAIATIFYVSIWAAHIYLMADPYDLIAVTLHKVFVAVLSIVAIRYIDRLIIVPILTRLSGGPPSRFIHQIVVTVLTVFVIAGYCSWAFGIEIGALLTGSAVISIVLGLALQETLGNFFSGMVLQASVPFQPGDWIQIGDTEGRVVEMTWRTVTLITNANNYVLLPNSSVAKETIINYHTPTVSTSANVAVGLDYSIPPNDAKRVLIRAAQDTPGVLASPEPSAALTSFDDSAITYKVFFWINEPQKHGVIEQAVRTNIWYRLNQAGFNIPFPIRTVEFTDMEKKQATARQEAIAGRLAAIKKSPLFSAIVSELQEKLAAETREFPLAAGQVFFRQNDPGDSLYLLEEGVVAITFQTDAGAKDIDVAELTAPALFGEATVFTGQPRGATYRAKTDVRVIQIDRDHLHDLFALDPNLMTHFSKIVSERQAQRDELLKKMGAVSSTAGSASHTESETVLDRMKRLFTLRHR